jgi:hypothetical protein
MPTGPRWPTTGQRDRSDRRDAASAETSLSGRGVGAVGSALCRPEPKPADVTAASSPRVQMNRRTGGTGACATGRPEHRAAASDDHRL